MKRKMLSFGLVLAAFLAVFALSASAAEPGDRFEVDDFYYDVLSENGTVGTAKLVEVGYSHLNEEKMVLPSTVKAGRVTYTVTSLGDERGHILPIPQGEGVFIEEGHWKELVIPTTITDPDSVSVIQSTGGHVPELERFTIQEASPLMQITDGILYSSDGGKLLRVPRTYQKKSLYFPSNVKECAKNAFYGCNLLEKVEFTGLDAIPDEAFVACSALSSITLPETLTKIGSFAFLGCVALEQMKIPQSVTEIGDYAFRACSSLTSLELPEGLMKLNSLALSLTSISSLYLPGNVEITNISEGEPYLRDMDELERIEVSPANTRYASANGVLFSKDMRTLLFCPKNNQLTAVPHGVEKIEKRAFYGNKGIISITFPDSVKIIEQGAFRECKNLKEVTLPSGLTEIGESAFFGCTGLTAIEIPGSLKTWDLGAFAMCTSLKELRLCEGLETIGKGAFSSCRALTEVAFPEGLREIGAYAFSSCIDLEKVLFPGGLEGVGEKAFSGCDALAKVNFQDGLKRIDSEAFSGCVSMTWAVIPDGVTFEDNPFSQCEKLTIGGYRGSSAERMAAKYGHKFLPLPYEGTPFTDIYTHWGRDAVKWGYEQKLINGVTATEFRPDRALNRAMLVTILHRFAGEPQAETKAEFPDVKQDAYYTAAANWAAEEKIVLGNEQGKFGPDDNVTREQLATILYRYESPAAGSYVPGDLAAFADGEKTGDFAREAMEWAVGVGLFRGGSNSDLNPGGTAARAQAITVMEHLAELG